MVIIKKIGIFLISVLILISLSGCKSKNEPISGALNISDVYTTEVDMEFPVGELMFGEYTFESVNREADIIVSGIIQKGKEKITKQTSDEFGDYSGDLIIYKFKIDEVIKGLLKEKNITIGSPAITFIVNGYNTMLEEETEYILYLKYNSEMDNYYVFNFEYGMFKIVDENIYSPFYIYNHSEHIKAIKDDLKK